MNRREKTQSTIRIPHSAFRQRGIALIITLIMLSVITFLAVTFLSISSRDKGSVNTTTDEAVARLAADAALERAKAEVLANILATTNPYNFDLRVSVNYVNRNGFDMNAKPVVSPNPTNVNYDYKTSGSTNFTTDQRNQNIANLLFDPRPPVFVMTNRNAPLDFRFYLDLNRNGQFDANGLWPVISPDPANPYYNLSGKTIPAITPGNTLSNNFTGDPEWIGILERPDQPHSATNKFVARYAFIALPASKTLDINYIHNQVVNRSLATANDGFMRNQGVGTWELNLAAFLRDLNTNSWQTYDYERPFNFRNNGTAFDDAFSLLTNRYAGNYSTLLPANVLFANGAAVLRDDNIDEYSDGPLMLGTTNIDESININKDDPSLPWPGADNVNHFFTHQELFDPNKTFISFTNRLLTAGATNSSYDRYTFYRMLAQLGTDSTPESGKINLNYSNAVAYFDNTGVLTNIAIIPYAETNFGLWSPTQFFTIAADRLLRTYTTHWRDSDPTNFIASYYGITNYYTLTNSVQWTNYPAFGITNIPVWVSNKYVYTPGIHRILQLAANIYDATGQTNRSFGATQPPHFFPSVFRPIFRRDNNANVFITGYQEVQDATIAGVGVGGTPPPMIDLGDKASLTANIPVFGSSASPEPLIYGIPLVIGAKKGFPNFNKFALQNIITTTRKLDFHRLAQQPVNRTNQMYILGISNVFGAQAWNSYTNPYPRYLQMIVVADVTVSLTNEIGAVVGPEGGTLSNRFSVGVATNISASAWVGFTIERGTLTSQNKRSFLVPLLTNNLVLSNSIYYSASANQHQFVRIYDSTSPTAPVQSDPDNQFVVPHLWLNLSTRLRFILVDMDATPNPRIVDYVNLSSSENPLDIMATLRANTSCDGNLPTVGDPDPGCLWCTNRLGDPTGTLGGGNVNTPTYGIMNQIKISLGQPKVYSDTFWNSGSTTTGTEKQNEIDTFYRRIFPTPDQLAVMTNAADLDFGAPFNPTRPINQYVRWEANDPLVHYTVPDLTDLFANTNNIELDTTNRNPVARLAGNSPNPLSDHYRPWGGNPVNAGETFPATTYNMAVKDPLVYRSDDWNFPTNKFATVGWLGRVHRGTPWQTVYLKASDLNITNFTAPLTNATAWTNFYSDAASKWTKWTGNMNPNDAFFTRPVEDRLLFDVFTTALNDNATRGRLSVNQTNLAAWSALLSGVIVLPDMVTNYAVVAPAGVYNPFDSSTWPPLVKIWTNINYTRANTNLFPLGSFTHKGDILAAPLLTEASPYLTGNTNALNDAIYEWLPQQTMSLLSLDEPRFVIYAYGQTLRPANHSIVTSGKLFGLCTNYQVTSEVATRSVVRIESLLTNINGTLTVTNNRAVVESFNVLPPD